VLKLLPLALVATACYVGHSARGLFLKLVGDPLDVGSFDALVAVSDLHIGSRRNAPLEYIGRLARLENADSLAVLGDLFDDLHRTLDLDELERWLGLAARVLELPRGLEVYCTLSKSSHDPILSEDVVELEVGGAKFVLTHRPMRALVGGLVCYMIHGDAIVSNGVLAYALEIAGEIAGVECMLERAARRSLGVGEEDWLFMGHTHRPVLDSERKIANPGSWKIYWRKSRSAAILAKRGEVDLVYPATLASTRAGRVRRI